LPTLVGRVPICEKSRSCWPCNARWNDRVSLRRCGSGSALGGGCTAVAVRPELQPGPPGSACRRCCNGVRLGCGLVSYVPAHRSRSMSRWPSPLPWVWRWMVPVGLALPRRPGPRLCFAKGGPDSCRFGCRCLRALPVATGTAGWLRGRGGAAVAGSLLGRARQVQALACGSKRYLPVLCLWRCCLAR
jgi:hypothetical protein